MRLKNSLSRAFVVIGAVLVAAMVLFPPFICVRHFDAVSRMRDAAPQIRAFNYTEYSFILDAPGNGAIDAGALSVQVLVMLVVVALVVLASESMPERKTDETP